MLTLRMGSLVCSFGVAMASGCSELAGLDNLSFGPGGASATSTPAASSTTGTGGSTAATGGNGGSAGGSNLLFSDDFERSDDIDVGNGWLEKPPQLFELSGGVVQKIIGGDYRDNIVYRPLAERQLDVEVTMEFQYVDLTPGYPALIVRGQPATIAMPLQFDSYILFVDDDASVATLARQRGTGGASPLAQLTFVSSLEQGATYRLRLRAAGSNPVSLDGFIEERIDDQWNTIATGHADDDAAERLDMAGVFGFTADDEALIHYDNFAAFVP